MIAVAAGKKIFREALMTSLELFKVMIPAAVAVRILQELGLVEHLGRALAPVMHLVGLPGSMGLVWATCLTTSMYGGLIVLSSMPEAATLTAAQVTVLASMMLIAHTLPIEVGVARKSGVRAPFMVMFRTGAAFLFGWLLNTCYHQLQWHQQTNIMLWKPAAPDAGLPGWAWSMCINMATIFAIIFALTIVLKILDQIGLNRLLSRCLKPVLNLIGISHSAAPITIIGMMLGLAYGGGLIIQTAKSGRIKARDILFSLSLMGLSHSLIEDTLIMLAIGARLDGILIGRVIYALVCMALLVRLVMFLPQRLFHRLFFTRPAP